MTDERAALIEWLAKTCEERYPYRNGETYHEDWRPTDDTVRPVTYGVLRAINAELARLSAEARALREALAKAHEAAEISECRIAEVYDYIVKARDAVNGSTHLASGVVPRGSLSVLQDIFEWLQKAKYGLGGRTNVAGSIAELTRAALAHAKGD